MSKGKYMIIREKSLVVRERVRKKKGLGVVLLFLRLLNNTFVTDWRHYCGYY